jgi:ribonucleoside-diphosphate reductase alpha chain
MPEAERLELGIQMTGERIQPTLPGVDEAMQRDAGVVEASDVPTVIDVRAGEQPAGIFHSDAPFCGQCGVQMQRAGSCHACPSCGTTSGCS